MPYCNVLAIRETINNFLRKPLGIGNHQIKIDAAKVNLKPIKRRGGKYSIAGLAITKPKPKKIGTNEAKNVSLKLKFYSLYKVSRALINYFIGICFFGS
jgi:hypothetical protein